MASTITADNGVVSGSAGIKSSADSSGVLALASGTGTTAVTIDTSQNVGIGTSSPAYKLDLSGAIKIGTGTDGGSGNLFLDNGSTFAQYGYRLGWFTGANSARTERMRLDENGNVGIGTSSPSQKLEVYGNVKCSSGFIGTTGTNGFALLGTGADTSSGGTVVVRNSSATYNPSGMEFYTNSAERARIDSSGNFLVGLTSAIAAGTVSNTAQFVSSAQGFNIVTRCSGATSGKYWHQGPDSLNNFIVYNQGNVGVYITDGGTSWSANSDERLKTTLTPFENAAEKVCSLRAGTGRYLTDDESVSRSFLIAQDVQAVLPEAVNVQSDEMGTLGLAYTDLIPLLTAAIQEQQALINNLTERLAALEGAK